MRVAKIASNLSFILSYFKKNMFHTLKDFAYTIQLLSI